ncbi:MAG: lamin tail domain-containing protein [Anaerolineaceae bacterium]|nr:lamin tail domain-containing protein [Anaerolineaceae bacterium]MCB9099629.1 lamin tail domain-containing protein [Anaerolineales bacterium]
MSTKLSYVLIPLVCLLVGLACAEIETSPANPPTDLPVSTVTLPPPPSPTPVTDAITPPPPNPTQPADDFETPPSDPAPSQPDGNLDTATVARVVDGDTIELTDGRRIRYIGVNTPERGQPYYTEASEVNRQLVDGRTVQLEFDQDTFDQYGRTLAYIWVDGVMANLEIIVRGYANAFTVPPNVKYDETFRQAEREAREAGRGLWAGSAVPLKIINLHADAPGSDRDNPNGEWVEIANQGSEPVNLAGYTLKDEANHIYTFGNFSVSGGSTFRLYSGQGQNTAAELYWGFIGESVWNNDSDAAFLRDKDGALVDVYSY